MYNLIDIDRNFWDCTSINTEEWIAKVLGKPLDYECDGRWLSEQKYKILEFIENDSGGVMYTKTEVDNVYNYEQNFSSVFQWQIFYPTGERDYMYCDDVYVAIEAHQGGDVRGNYGAVQLYRADYLADSGFFDWVIGWSVNYANGEPVEQNDRFGIGYASNPTCELQDHLKDSYRTKVQWSEKRQCFVAPYENGRFVELHPVLYV